MQRLIDSMTDLGWLGGLGDFEQVAAEMVRLAESKGFISPQLSHTGYEWKLEERFGRPTKPILRKHLWELFEALSALDDVQQAA